eukprot:2605317-Rhodomonas_salina.1
MSLIAQLVFVQVEDAGPGPLGHESRLKLHQSRLEGFRRKMAERPPDALAWTWGWGEFGRLGHGDTTSMREPAALTHEALRGVVMIACGGHHTLAALENGEILSWGWGNEGQLGSGNNFDQMFPCLVRSMGNHRVIALACGMYHSVAVTDVGAVFCWGKGNCGQLGHGEIASSLLPRTVSLLHDAK